VAEVAAEKAAAELKAAEEAAEAARKEAEEATRALEKAQAEGNFIVSISIFSLDL
jgi:hypothetical protein